MDALNLPFYDFMVDLETTGTNPDRHCILQAAIVAFDWERGRIGPSVSVNMEMPAWRSWDEDTRNWWARQDPAVFAAVTENPIHPFAGAKILSDFVRAHSGALGGPRMWAKPLSFEFPFVASLMRDANLDNPFFFRDAIDMQSFIRGSRFNPAANAFDREVPFVGDAHSALDDVYHQIRVALVAKARFVNPEGDYDAERQPQAEGDAAA